MTARERFLRVMRYEPVDRLPLVALEPHETATLERWRAEGLPAGQSPEAYLGMDIVRRVPMDFGPRPAFERRVIHEDDSVFVEVDGMGCTIRRRKDAPLMYYGFIDHPVKTRDDWERYRERLDARTPGHLPADLDALAAELNASEMPVGLDLYPSFFRMGFFLMGMERFLTAFHDAPDLIHDFFAHYSAFFLELLRPVLARIRLDFVTFAEDLAYRAGPHISPATYRQFWLPYQDPIVRELQRHGVPVIALWTSGNIDALLPLLIERGINCTWPAERQAGMDPLRLRREYGRGLRVGGGMAKEALAAGSAAIDREIDRLLPLMREGGFVPAADDMIPPEVSLESYRHYIQAIRGIRLG